MASKTIEEMMQKASANAKQQLQEQVQTLRGINSQIKDVRQPDLAPDAGSKPDSKRSEPEPLHKETTPQQSQRGAEKIKQSMPTDEKTKATEQGKNLDKSGAKDTATKAPAPTPDKGR